MVNFVTVEAASSDKRNNILAKTDTSNIDTFNHCFETVKNTYTNLVYVLAEKVWSSMKGLCSKVILCPSFFGKFGCLHIIMWIFQKYTQKVISSRITFPNNDLTFHILIDKLPQHVFKIFKEFDSSEWFISYTKKASARSTSSAKRKSDQGK